MLKLIAYAAVPMLVCWPAWAQQVQVFSDGKPIPVADAANASRARIPDEHAGRRPLAERPDAQAIARAHALAVVRCGLDESRYPAEQAPTPEELAYVAAQGSYLPLPGGKEIIFIGEYLRGKAVVDPEHLAVHTPQCPAGVAAMFWSHDTSRIMFATQAVTGMQFHGSRLLWTARFAPAQDVWVYAPGHEGKHFRKLISLPKEKVVDIYLPDGSDQAWILSQTDKIDLRTPRAWLRAASGTPTRKMDILLRQVDARGQIVSTVTVAQGVANGLAQFIREPAAR